MTIRDYACTGTHAGIGPGTGIGVANVAALARELVAGLIAEPWGQVSASVYETGRLVTLAPWLTRHAERLRYLMEAQRPDGGWGAPGGYALVPTLSATEAILATLRRSRRRGEGGGENGEVRAEQAGDEQHELAQSADRGLRALCGWLNGAGTLSLPDMPAIELIVPSLIVLINEHLDSLAAEPVKGLDPRRCGGRLRPLARMDGAALMAIRSRLASGAAISDKLLHALEVTGDTAAGLRTIRPEATGTVGASPAATAAWLKGRRPPAARHPARRYLEAAVARHQGPVPCGLPVTVFERAWVLSWLTRVGIDAAVPVQLIRSLESALGPAGTPAAAGLPPDADTTAGVLYALCLHGAPHPPDVLWAYELDTHFCTWQGEDGMSVSTNAHVLEAFGQFLQSGPVTNVPMAVPMARYAATADKVSAWLCEQQEADGSWQDRWHASPYYATACCALALDRFGGAWSAAAVRRAVDWVLATQRADGSWGCWEGTAEETAYAVQILLTWPDDQCMRAAARGRMHLLRAIAASGIQAKDHPPLWHDKDLYLPIAIVRAAILAALHLTADRDYVPTG